MLLRMAWGKLTVLGGGWLRGADSPRRKRMDLPASVTANLVRWLDKCASISSSAVLCTPSRSRRSVDVLIGRPIACLYAFLIIVFIFVNSVAFSRAYGIA